MGVVQRRAVVLILAVAVVAAVATPVVLALSGQPEAAVKFVLFAILLAGLPVVVMIALAASRAPRWYRNPTRLATALSFGGAAAFVLVFLVWLPLSPYRWRIEEVPAPLRWPMLAALAVVMAGMLIGVAYELPAAWRRHDWREAARYLLSLVLLVWLGVSAMRRVVP